MKPTTKPTKPTTKRAPQPRVASGAAFKAGLLAATPHMEDDSDDDRDDSAELAPLLAGCDVAIAAGRLHRLAPGQRDVARDLLRLAEALITGHEKRQRVRRAVKRDGSRGARG